MAHYTLIARINRDDGKFPFVSVQFSKNHRPIPIEGATYYLRPSGGDKRTPIKIGKDISWARTAIIRMEDGRSLGTWLRCAKNHGLQLPQRHRTRQLQRPREST